MENKTFEKIFVREASVIAFSSADKRRNSRGRVLTEERRPSPPAPPALCKTGIFPQVILSLPKKKKRKKSEARTRQVNGQNLESVALHTSRPPPLCLLLTAVSTMTEIHSDHVQRLRQADSHVPTATLASTRTTPLKRPVNSPGDAAASVRMYKNKKRSSRKKKKNLKNWTCTCKKCERCIRKKKTLT